MYDYDEITQKNESIANQIIEENKIGNTKLEKLEVLEEKYSSKRLNIAAKNIKKIVKDLYPEILMVKIASSRFANGDSITVSLIYDKNISEEEQKEYRRKEKHIEGIISVFSDSGFDGMTDSSYSLSNSFNNKYGSAKFVHASARSYYDEEKESFFKKKIKEEKKQIEKVLKQNIVAKKSEEKKRL